jgi:hypothetical protein
MRYAYQAPMCSTCGHGGRSLQSHERGQVPQPSDDAVMPHWLRSLSLGSWNLVGVSSMYMHIRPVGSSREGRQGLGLHMVARVAAAADM